MALQICHLATSLLLLHYLTLLQVALVRFLPPLLVLCLGAAAVWVRHHAARSATQLQATALARSA
jgi:hypothetical protein